MRAYLLKVTDKMQIPAVVYEVLASVHEEPVYVFLEHHEPPNIMRGRNQPLDNPSVDEGKRPDGGLSWPHSGTFCLMRARLTKDPKNVGKAQALWGDDLKGLLSAQGYDGRSIVYRDSDLYIRNGSEKHLMGLSGLVSGNGQSVIVQRACWYERDPLPNIEHLLKADGIDPKTFKEKLQLVKPGFFAYSLDLFKPEEVDPCDFISIGSMADAVDLQKQKGGNVRGYCVLGRQNS